MAKVVRGADASGPHDAPPGSASLKAAARGFKFISTDDYENIERRFPTYDTFYMYCQLKVQTKE